MTVYNTKLYFWLLQITFGFSLCEKPPLLSAIYCWKYGLVSQDITSQSHFYTSPLGLTLIVKQKDIVLAFGSYHPFLSIIYQCLYHHVSICYWQYLYHPHPHYRGSQPTGSDGFHPSKRVCWEGYGIWHDERRVKRFPMEVWQHCQKIEILAMRTQLRSFHHVVTFSTKWWF